MSTLGKRQRTFGTDWLYVTAVIIVVSIVLRMALTFVFHIGASLANSLTLLVFLSMLGAVKYYAKMNLPIFVLYDHGIKVIQRGEEKIYLWSQIKYWDGMRNIFYAYFIPVVKYGANHFYDEQREELFSVSVWSSRSETLVTYIFSKFAEQQIAHYSELIESGETVTITDMSNLGVLFVQYKPLQISKTGIGSDSIWFEWNEIEEFTFSKVDVDPVVKVRLTKSDKFQKLGQIPKNAQFLLMGIIDYMLDTAYLPEMQDYLMDYKQQAIVVGKFALKFVIVLVVLTTVAIGIPVGIRASQGLPIFSP